MSPRGSPTLELPSSLSPSSSSSSNQLLSFFHAQTSSLCFMHLAAFLGRLHMLQSAGSQLGSGCGSFVNDPEDTRAGSRKIQSAAVINAQLV